MSENLKLAVLIDADNASPDTLAPVLTDVARHGTAYVRRIYGNWATPHLTGWHKLMHEHALTPMQQFAVTVGKNATDSALIIDAMDLLYTGRFGGFCIVSSDSDFSRLASRLRESGLRVFGYGRAQTPISFRRACDEFIDVGLLARPAQATANPAAAGTANAPKLPKESKAAKPPKRPAEPKTAKSPLAHRPSESDAALALLVNDPDAGFFDGYGDGFDNDAGVEPDVSPEVLLRKALGNLDPDQDGYVQLADLSTMVRRLDPEFNVRAYGCNQFIKLVRQQLGLVVRTHEAGGRTQHFVRLREVQDAEGDIPF